MTDKATLRNGYVYRKELLVQHHNFKRHADYTKLAENHIGVWSVKTDAFVIRKEHLRRAKNLMKFNERIGGWRHEKRRKKSGTHRAVDTNKAIDPNTRI